MKDAAEFQERRRRLEAYLNQEGVGVFFVFNPYNLFYLTRFFHVSTERPVVYAMTADGRTHLLVPALEEAVARTLGEVDSVRVYFEFPGTRDPLADFFADLARGDRTRVQSDSLTLDRYQQLKNQFPDVRQSDVIVKTRSLKSFYEIGLLRKAAAYADYLVTQGMGEVKPGMTEMELLSIIEQKTVTKMVRELDELIYVPGGPVGGLVPSGERTALPHALPSARVIRENENIILSCGANVEGYRAECERTVFLGEPGLRYREAFKVMAEAQWMAVDMMKPGTACGDIDRKVLDFICSRGFGEGIKHRTGHGKGLEEHEPPWVEAGDPTVLAVLAPGMVVSSEPGIYIDGFAGFRHSDTVLITETGAEVLTTVTRDLEGLIISPGGS